MKERWIPGLDLEMMSRDQEIANMCSSLSLKVTLATSLEVRFVFSHVAGCGMDKKV